MSRDGSGIYTQPFPDVVTNTPVSSAVFNGFVHDITTDLNAARPIVAGGTGANNAGDALFNFKAEKAAQVVTNYDSHLFVPGSFYSETTATGEPVDGQAFSGIAYINEALANPPTNANVTLEARSLTDGRLFIRRKVANVWGSWTLDGDLSGVNAAIALKVAKAGDTMSGFLVLHADPDTAMKAATKQYVDAGTASATAAASAANTNANTRVLKAGDTMTGALTLNGNPGSALVAAPKQYVDAAAGARIISVNQQEFTASGTYTPSAGMVYCIIECIGGGGGGGSGHSTTNTINGGGGGGSGGYSRLLATAATIGASKAVTIGAAGAAGAGPDNNGGAGGDTSVGTLCIAKGGLGGQLCNTGTIGHGGAGAGISGAVGDITAGGAPGGHGQWSSILTVVFPSGNGGSSVMGGGALGVNGGSGTLAPGAAASSYGSGGSGGQANNIANATGGGAGSAGLVIITEYCTQ
jgi:hypothetical protein